MKESIGYTVTLNIMIVFITIVVAFLCAALIYFKSNKASNVITTAIEKYEEYSDSAKEEINRNLTSLGYGSTLINCDSTVEEPGVYSEDSGANKCTLIKQGTDGYCIYVCYEENKFDHGKYQGEYYYYKIRTNMMINIPIIHDVLPIPIYSNTNRLYNFDKDVRD